MSRINMSDDADAVAKKIRKATTDPEALPGPAVLDADGQLPEETRKERPEAYNLLGIYAALSDKSLADTLSEFEGAQFSHFKQVLTDLAVAVLGPIGAEMNRMADDPSYVDSVLRNGAGRAREIAAPIVKEVEDIVGFLSP